MASDSPNVEELFFSAVKKRPEEWSTYLDEVCRGDSELRERVELLLRARGKVQSFLEEPAPELIAPLEYSDATLLDMQIGPYKLREQIGEGGMGVVYVAEQSEPVKRKVALKIIKPGMASRNVVARFEGEQQALAMMDHPNIAKVHDGGATDSGQPYFVMELIQGLPITEYCDDHKLNTRERLKLFEKVCRAVQHAHQKGIIHRDLKPSNVLVPRIDGEAVPKVIDFGVAKAVGQKLTEQTVYTQFTQLVGTPLYMSPEQAEFGVVDIDTRSDVYSLGVLLYVLLTGSTPFDSETLKQANFDEMRRIIREDEPPRPSARISTLNGEELSTISQRRSCDPQLFSASLRGELDWIVMKALEKDRDRRYESAGALAADVAKYLRDEPIVARPASRWYRVKKFIRRNRVLVASLAAIIVALFLGAVMAVVGLLHANEQRDIARQTQASLNEQLAVSEAAFEVLWSVFSLPRWGQETSLESLTLMQAIEQMEQGLSDRLKDQPEVEIRIRSNFANFYRQLGMHARARKHLYRALALAQSVYGDESSAVAHIHVLLADELEWSLTEPRDVTALANHASEGIRIFDAVGEETHRVSHAWFLRSRALTLSTQFDEAEQYLRKALDLVHFGDGDIEQQMWARCDLADLLSKGDADDVTEADALRDEASDLLDAPGFDSNPEALRGMLYAARGRDRRLQGKPMLAIADFEASWDIYKRDDLRVENRGHRNGLALAELYVASGQDDQANVVLDELRDIVEELSEPAESMAQCHLFEGWRHMLRGEVEGYADAERCFRKALDYAISAHPSTHPMMFLTNFQLAESLRRQGTPDKVEDARKYYRQARDLARPYATTDQAWHDMSWIYATSLLHSEAQPNPSALSDAYDRAERALDDAQGWGWSWEQPQLYLTMAIAKHKLNDTLAAIELLEEGLIAWQKPFPSIHDTRTSIPTSRRDLEHALAEYTAESESEDVSTQTSPSTHAASGESPSSEQQAKEAPVDKR